MSLLAGEWQSVNHYRELAECLDLPQEWFFQERNAHKKGREVCASCRVHIDCLIDGLQPTRPGSSGHEGSDWRPPSGIWGGRGVNERLLLLGYKN